MDAETRLRLSAQAALLARVTPALRAVSVDALPEERCAWVRFVFDGEPLATELQAASRVHARIAAEFRGEFRVLAEYVSCQAPGPMEHLRWLVFLRYQGSPDFDPVPADTRSRPVRHEDRRLVLVGMVLGLVIGALPALLPAPAGAAGAWSVGGVFAGCLVPLLRLTARVGLPGARVVVAGRDRRPAGRGGWPDPRVAGRARGDGTRAQPPLRLPARLRDDRGLPEVAESTGDRPARVGGPGTDSRSHRLTLSSAERFGVSPRAHQPTNRSSHASRSAR